VLVAAGLASGCERLPSWWVPSRPLGPGRSLSARWWHDGSLDGYSSLLSSGGCRVLAVAFGVSATVGRVVGPTTLLSCWYLI